jgi:NPL4 family
VTNGFPTKSAPLFLSSKFPIENRSGLADQSADIVFRDLMRIMDGGKKEHIAPSDGDTRKSLVEWLSDWHLLAFLQETGLVGEEEMKSMIKVATSHDQSAALDDLLAKPGWQTLLAIAKESAPAKGPGEGTWNSNNFGSALDEDELTAEEIAAIIASTEETSIGGNTDADTPAFQDSRSAFSSRRPSPPPAAPKPSTSASTSSAIARSSTAVLPVDSGTRTVQEEYEWTGGDDDDDGAIELDDDDDDEDDAFDDANSEVEEVLDNDDGDDDDDVQMTSAAPSNARAPARAAPASRTAQPTSARNQEASIVDLTEDDDTNDAGGSQKACPTCTVLNPADADSCYLCGLPMNV